MTLGRQDVMRKINAEMFVFHQGGVAVSTAPLNSAPSHFSLDEKHFIIHTGEEDVFFRHEPKFLRAMASEKHVLVAEMDGTKAVRETELKLTPEATN